MAEKLESYSFKHRGVHGKYPWGEWESGIWRVTHPADFECMPTSFITTLHAHARNRGIKVRTTLTGNVIVFQFFQPDPK